MWLRRQAPIATDRADLFCNFNMSQNTSVGQSGNKTTTIATTISSPYACATPPPGVTVHKPDLRLEFDNRQVDGFDYAGG